MSKMFSKVWQLRGHDLRQWLFYNVFLGLLPVWLSWFTLALAETWKFEVPFLDGTFLIFTATLSGASLGFYSDEAKATLKHTERLLYNWLLVVLLLGATGFTAITVIKEFAPAKLSESIVFCASSVILLLAIWFNLNLAAVRLVSGDAELKASLVDGPKQVAEQAKHAVQVDGVKL
jgi:hypothetical protein